MKLLQITMKIAMDLWTQMKIGGNSQRISFGAVVKKMAIRKGARKPHTQRGTKKDASEPTEW